MKVILNEDVKHLGEMGDVKMVANGYARNYLFPRNLAVPYNDMTVAYFEGKKAEIEARKEEVLSKNGFEVERKKIEVPGLTIKSVGKYTVTIHLYEASTASVTLEVKPQEEAGKASDSKAAPKAEEAPAASEEKAE